MSKYENISCHHFIEINGYAYFSNWLYNAFFRTELKTGKTMFLGAFEMEMQDEFNIHWELLLQEDLIYFFPRRGRHIHIYSLRDHFVSAIEVRKASEAFFRIGEVIVKEKSIILQPMEKDAPIRRFDLNTHAITDITSTQNVDKNPPLSQYWPIFPEPQLLEKYQIGQADKFSWKEMPDGRWCAFLPTGRHLLWYAPRTRRIDAMPLVIENEAELDAYLQPLRQTCLCREETIEGIQLSTYEYLKTITRYRHETGGLKEEKRFAGEKIWRALKI